MSISVNNPLDTLTSTGGNGSLELIVEGGTPTNPKPIRLNSSSVIMPVQSLPTGEAGAMVFDRNTLTMKYHDGFNWIEILSKDDITSDLQAQIDNIRTTLGSKVDNVIYSSSAIPGASISGTTLNIVFPTANSIQGGTGLYTSSKPGSIMHYSLTSGQTISSVREQMSGSVNGQSGRNGTQAAPWKTSDGWCLADGQWWTWEGTNGIVTKQVPNLNQNAYLKGISTSGITKTDAVIAQSASLTPYEFTIPEHYHGTGMQIDSNNDDAAFILGKTWNDGTSYRGIGIFGDKDARLEFNVNGNNANSALSTTRPIYSSANAAKITHNHTIQDLDVTHFNVAILYNIAEPSTALSENVANTRYVRKSGDTMTGTLSIANTASITGDGTNLQLFFRSTNGGERAAIYHQSSTGTLRIRSNGGPEVTVNNSGSIAIPGTASVTGNATVGGKNIVRSVNGTTADANGNVTLAVGVVSDVRLGTELYFDPGHNEISWIFRCPSGYMFTGINVQETGRNSADNIGGVWYRPVQKLVNGTWITVQSI